MVRSRNHFAAQTNSGCVVIYLHVTVRYIKFLSLNNKAFMINLCSRQQWKLCWPVFERNFILIHLHSFSLVAYKGCIETKESSFTYGIF